MTSGQILTSSRRLPKLIVNVQLCDFSLAQHMFYLQEKFFDVSSWFYVRCRELLEDYKPGSPTQENQWISERTQVNNFLLISERSAQPRHGNWISDYRWAVYHDKKLGSKASGQKLKAISCLRTIFCGAIPTWPFLE